jgi:integrase/recombinase XerD
MILNILKRTLESLEKLENNENKQLIKDFHNYLKFDALKETTERAQVNNLKYIINLARFLGSKSFEQVDKLDIQNFLETKKKSSEIDPDQKWITTYNDYLRKIKYY